MSKERTMKPVVSRASRVLLTLLAAGFTLISAYNGFTFYKVLFGLSMSVLITSTFEVARLSCLFSFMGKGKKIGALGTATYIVVALVCAFAAINSFTYEIIKRDRAGQGQYREQIQRIKQAYSKKIEEKITASDRDITYLENKVAKYPESGYWKRRLSQSVTNRGELVTRRDTFLATQPENPGQWVAEKSAILGLELEKPSSESEDMVSVTQALRELWGLKKTTAQKIMGIVVTLTVEFSILLLSFLSHVSLPKKKPQSVAGVKKFGKKSRSVAKSREMSPGVVSVANKTDIDEKPLKKFVDANREHFEKTGKLLPMKKLNKNLRPIRKIVIKFNQENLKELFEK